MKVFGVKYSKHDIIKKIMELSGIPGRYSIDYASELIKKAHNGELSREELEDIFF